MLMISSDVIKYLNMSNYSDSLSKLSEKVNNDTFKIQVVGTFKNGKSTFINALLGSHVLPAYSLPCTAVINEVKYGKEPTKPSWALQYYDLIQIAGTDEESIKQEYRNIFLTKNSKESILEVQHSDDGNYDTGFGHKLDRDAAAPHFTGTTAAYTPTAEPCG